MTTPNPIQTHGFTAIPASSTTFTAPATQKGIPPKAIIETPIPRTPLAQRILTYAQTHLPTPTLHHSLRVYHYGLAMKQYLSAQDNNNNSESYPGWAEFSDETFFLACMLHDIGTTEENMRETRLSFEFAGGLRAWGVLLGGDDGEGEGVASREQAESVVEAIVRHQDLCEVGWITAIGGVLQLGTIFGEFLSIY